MSSVLKSRKWIKRVALFKKNNVQIWWCLKSGLNISPQFRYPRALSATAIKTYTIGPRSQWGAWGACSITCGAVGEGVMARGRHVAVEANYGGRQCSGNKVEMMTCYHMEMEIVKRNNIKDAIYFCPGNVIFCIEFKAHGSVLMFTLNLSIII